MVTPQDRWRSHVPWDDTSYANYGRFLSDMWRAAQAPRANFAPTSVSLFAGCGGSLLGTRMAGFDERLAVEWDRHAVAVMRANFPDLPIYFGDICGLASDVALKLAGVLPGELDLLDGSPPCQGFSTAGRRILNDERNVLFREFVRLLRAFRPRAFIMENVPGLVRGKMLAVFTEALHELKASGYAVSARILGAKWYEVPQSRERLIFVGFREDTGRVPSHPQPFGDAITLREALQGVFEDPSGPETPTPTPLQINRWNVTARGEAHYERFGLMRLDWHQPAPTLLKEPGSGGHFHPDEPRFLTVPELKRISSFPPEFVLPGTWIQAVNRMGNAVPPLMMFHIARHVRRLLEMERMGEIERAGAGGHLGQGGRIKGRMRKLKLPRGMA
jgi:DNA (cytosine-5)-methyltransferase 1